MYDIYTMLCSLPNDILKKRERENDVILFVGNTSPSSLIEFVIQLLLLKIGKKVKKTF